MINRFLFEANFLNRITVHGTGKQHRPFIHIDKAATILSRLANEPLLSGTYNLVEQNMPVGEVVEKLRVLYPSLEMLFVNQHMNMRELKVKGSTDLLGLLDTKKDFTEELRDFKAVFTF